MEPNAKHFINPRFLAPNVKEVDVSLDLLAPLLALAPQLQEVTSATREFTLDNGLALQVAHPAGWNSNITWMTQRDEPTYRFFERLFHALGIAGYVAGHIGHEKDIRLYTGMLVARSNCEAAFFHTDWIDTNNDAFTFLTPITDNFADIGLVYRNVRGVECRYDYQPGKGIVFGDHFVHATAPGKSDRPAILLAFQFGTDRMDRWDQMLASAYQGGFHCQPDGQFKRSSS